jgi:predicted metal-dependent HD superfamily phosphohydrolase
VDLVARWSRLCGPGATAAGEALLRAWAEPHRRYHTQRHLAAVLDHLDELDADPPTVTSTSPDRWGAGATPPGPSWTARVAAWYHDAVYDPAAGDNEARSAAWAGRDLTAAGHAPPVASEVARLVLLTVEHRPLPSDRAGALLCDADLAVLGQPDAVYADYVAAVRAEYAAVDDGAWRAGRGAVLAGLLGRDRLYVTDEGAQRWEARARRNLARELSDLR